MSELQVANSVYNIEIEKIDPNPDQPRKHFSEESLGDLAESIRRYGVMQPITVSRRESETPEGLTTRYEIIAGERRWRASIQAGMSTIPAIIHDGPESAQDKFELSILENLQREDLNPVDKARSFARLADEFGMKHAEIADRLGKSREYVTNAMRLLVLPSRILDALGTGEINEGHTRPLLMLKDSPDELQVLFQEIITKGLTVREAETVARTLSGQVKKTPRYPSASVALDPEMQALQSHLSGALGTQVSIDAKEKGGQLTIDFFSREDLKKIVDLISASGGNLATPLSAQTVPQGHSPEVAHSLGDQVEGEAQSVVSETTTLSREGEEPLHMDASDATFSVKPRRDHFESSSPAGDDELNKPSSSIIGQSHLVSHRTAQLQEEINALAGASGVGGEDDLNMRTKVELGEIERPEPIQQDIQPVEITSPSDVPEGAPSHAQVDSTSVQLASADFVPPDLSQEAIGEVQGEIMGGSEFVSSDVPTDQVGEPEQKPPSSAQITMGGLDGSMGGEPLSSSDKYPQGDPYRLDTFSV